MFSILDAFFKKICYSELCCNMDLITSFTDRKVANWQEFDQALGEIERKMQMASREVKVICN